MSNWYYSRTQLRQTPSSAKGMDCETEQRYRREGSLFIQRVGTAMGLKSQRLLPTSALYFHRFYMCHSFTSFPPFPTATACLLLAGKVEETPKKCKDFVRTAEDVLSASEFSTFGKHPNREVQTLERILLQSLRFDLQVEHPYEHILKFANGLKGDEHKIKEIVIKALSFTDNSYCITLCLQWEPEIIAIALIFFASKLFKFEFKDWKERLSTHKHWWDVFVEDLTIEILEDICHQMIDLLFILIGSPSEESPTSIQAQTSQSHSSNPLITTHRVIAPVISTNVLIPNQPTLPYFPINSVNHLTQIYGQNQCQPFSHMPNSIPMPIPRPQPPVPPSFLWPQNCRHFSQNYRHFEGNSGQ